MKIISERDALIGLQEFATLHNVQSDDSVWLAVRDVCGQLQGVYQVLTADFETAYTAHFEIDKSTVSIVQVDEFKSEYDGYSPVRCFVFYESGLFRVIYDAYHLFDKAQPKRVIQAGTFDLDGKLIFNEVA